MEVVASSQVKTSVLDLYLYPEIVTKNVDVLNRLNSGLKLAGTSLGVPSVDLKDISEERGRGLVNRVYFIDTQADLHPDAVMLLMNPERKTKQAFERTVAAYKLLKNKLPEISEGVCMVPNVLGINESKQILIIEY